MVKYCKFKSVELQEKIEELDDVTIIDSDIFDPYAGFWGVWNDLDANNPIVYVQNSYGETLMKCKKTTFDELFTIE